MAITVLLLTTIVIIGMIPSISQGSQNANRFPNVPLVTHEGEKVYFYDDLIKGKVVVINFIYTTCPDSCPLETAQLREVQDILGERVGKDIFMYSISINPDQDTPETLKHYADKFAVKPGWLFLTGNKDDITLLQKRFGMYVDETQNGDDLDHDISMIAGNEAIGMWVKRSPFESPKGLANLIGYRLFDGMVHRKDARSYANAPEVPNFSRGHYLYRTRCAVCHTIGQGDRLGPDLYGVVDRRDRGWLISWLKAPDEMLANKDPIALGLFAKYQELPMPNLQLSDDDVMELIDYLADESAKYAANVAKGR